MHVGKCASFRSCWWEERLIPLWFLEILRDFPENAALGSYYSVGVSGLINALNT